MDDLSFAPEFADDLVWVNAEGPIRLGRELSGHVVVLAFWNASDVHSRHLLATLMREARRNADRAIAVLAVHAPKFAAHRGAAAVQETADQRGIEFPIAVDDDLRVWHAFSCRAWPTLVLIDPVGQMRFRGSGEVEGERLERVVDALYREAQQDGHLSEPVSLPRPARPSPAGGVLASPTKLAVDAARRWLWIADTGHHRVIAADMASGEVQLVAGTGRRGRVDGALTSAAFCEPRGLAVDADTVWVADTGQHLVRAISIHEEEVRTVLGQGRRVADLHGGGFGEDQGLASPWDLCLHQGELYIAMAGVHQVWSLDPHTDIAVAFVGTGRPDLHDGDPPIASLAQPSGLAAAGPYLCIADAQSSAVRLVDLHQSHVATAIGVGLREFGDVDGPWSGARLQYPTDVAACGGDWIVADTYNDKVKRMRTSTREIETVVGADAGLAAPEGVAVHGSTLFVADTGHHRILRVDLDSGECEELALRGLPQAP